MWRWLRLQLSTKALASQSVMKLSSSPRTLKKSGKSRGERTEEWKSRYGAQSLQKLENTEKSQSWGQRQSGFHPWSYGGSIKTDVICHGHRYCWVQNPTVNSQRSSVQMIQLFSSQHFSSRCHSKTRPWHLYETLWGTISFQSDCTILQPQQDTEGIFSCFRRMVHFGVLSKCRLGICRLCNLREQATCLSHWKMGVTLSA